MSLNWKDFVAGIFFVGTGLLYGGIAWVTLPVGTAIDMGPGYFPTILSAALILIGGLIALRALFDQRETSFGIVPWRALVMLSLATVTFAAFVDDLGMMPGVFVTTFLATRSSRQITIARGIFTGLCIAAFCTIVFIYGIRLPIPIFGPVFGM